MMRHVWVSTLLVFAAPAFAADGSGGVIKSVQSGPWSAAATWEGGKVPGALSKVQVRTGHTVTYDVQSEAVIRCINVAGTLAFAPDRNTRLEVGLIKIQTGDAY